MNGNIDECQLEQLKGETNDENSQRIADVLSKQKHNDYELSDLSSEEQVIQL